nr:NAD(P)/FAD-dependent oxidoreductase [Pleurocapsa sp. PCC 7319]
MVGAGFAGLRAVKRLSDADAEVLLIDRYNYHTFIPMLYQVATGFIEPELIAYPIRKALRNIFNADFLMAEVEQINPDNKTITADGRTMTYDYLVLSSGSQANFLGVSGAPQFTFPLRTLDNAIVLRNHILSCFEQAVKNLENSSLQEQLLTFVIVGGGPTGVEMAGALQELIYDCLVKDYPQLDLERAKVILLQSGSDLLASYPKHLQKYTVRTLRDRGVKVHFNNRVKETSSTEVVLEDETRITTATIIWTAGVEASLPKPQAEVSTASKNKVEVQDTLQLPKYPHVYAVGDVAYVEQDGKPLVGIAPEALQQGGMVAENLQRQLKGKSPKAFNYFNKGRAAIIARNAGVILLLGKIPLGGFLGWLMWLGIHLYYLPGLSNRFKVLGAWLKDYLRRDRSVRQVYTMISADSRTQLK